MAGAFLFALALACLTGGPVNAQGTLPVALAQQSDGNGRPLAGALLYVYVVGTVATPQNTFQDAALTQVLPWPLSADNNGRLPMFYLASGSVHVRLTDATGGLQFDYPQMLVIGASGGGGGGGATIDPTSIAATGDVKFKISSETLAGWVAADGRTVGSATSGATSRANADTQSLFVYLWTNCINAHCPVSGGRGATALADFSANKTITLPDMRGRLPVGRDCMETTCASRLLNSDVTSGGGDTADTAGGSGGISDRLILQTHLPAVNFNNAGITLNDPNHQHTFPVDSGLGGNASPAAGNGVHIATDSTTNNATGITISNQGHAVSGGSGTALPVMNPFALVKWFIKL